MVLKGLSFLTICTLRGHSGLEKISIFIISMLGEGGGLESTDLG